VIRHLSEGASVRHFAVRSQVNDAGIGSAFSTYTMHFARWFPRATCPDDNRTASSSVAFFQGKNYPVPCVGVLKSAFYATFSLVRNVLVECLTR